ncbi:MAG: BamA/TamA family outer membrane protein [Gemmatimonadota bacterium]|nr:BamA/TamA family outer membrane protein [Gemmatimonadota bacterium]
MRRGVALARLPLLALALCCAPAVMLAQDLRCDLGDPEIRSVSFQGNKHFNQAQLASAIVTTASAFTRRIPVIPFGAKHCLDAQELRTDVLRLRAFYLLRGYYRTAIDTVVTHTNGHTVLVTFRVTEGPPVPIDSIAVAGLEQVRDGPELGRLMLSLKGTPYDRVRLAGIEDSIRLRLREEGYAHAERPTGIKQLDSARLRATVVDSFPTGPIARVDSIRIEVASADPGRRPEIKPSTIRSLLAIHKGDLFREGAMLESQRRLYQLEVYRQVEIGLDSSDARNRTDSLLTVDVRLVEGDLRTLRVGAGWATNDCFRTQARYTDRNFLGGARRLELNGRLSKIGIGRPLDTFRDSFCQPIRQDSGSQKLNYFTEAVFRPPTLFGAHIAPSFSLYSERRSEFEAYVRYTRIGLGASATRLQQPRLPLTLSYQLEYGSTEAQPVVFCQLFNLCEADAIHQAGRVTLLNAVSLTGTRDRTDNPVDPQHGTLLRVETRQVFTSTGSQSPQVTFNRFLGDAAWYQPAGRGAVLAMRIQIGGVVSGQLHGAAHENVPPQERLYAGGPNSVRGFGQNQLGPVVYVVDTFAITNGGVTYEATPTSRVRQISPVGGNALLVSNAELRLRSPFLPDLLQWAAFVDAGQVWNRSDKPVDISEVRITPGLGLRLLTKIGPVRVDVGYNPYGLTTGQAYYFARSSVNSPLLCVSPGNTLNHGDPNSGTCAATFSVPKQSFGSRLTWNFSIGQAF